VLLSLVLPSLAWANIGPKWWGDRTAEPLGLKGVAIIRENLTIDLRPLAAVQPVEVGAVYSLNNSGSARKLHLLFVTGVTGVSDFEVRLDGRLVESRRVSPRDLSSLPGEVPKSWQPPDHMPYFDREEWRSGLILYDDLAFLAFDLDLPPGRCSLSARYRARPFGVDEGYPTVTWQFPYILAPAREWESFGGLDVAVYLPENWQSKSTPALQREGGVLRGSFANLPADCLALAVRAPFEGELRQRLRYTIAGWTALYALEVIGGGILCWWAGRLLGRFLARKTSPGTKASIRVGIWILPFAFLITAGWAATIVATWGLTQHTILGVFAGQENPYFGYRFLLPECGTYVLALCIFPIGFILVRKGARRSLQNTVNLG